jgi:hypothetical protein
MTSDWSLYTYTFFPRLRTASSSSRMAFRTRPHGLRTRRYTNRQASATIDQPTRSTQNWLAEYVTPTSVPGMFSDFRPPEKGLRSKKSPAKFWIPAAPPVVSRYSAARRMRRMISPDAIVTMAR